MAENSVTLLWVVAAVGIPAALGILNTLANMLGHHSDMAALQRRVAQMRAEYARRIRSRDKDETPGEVDVVDEPPSQAA